MHAHVSTAASKHFTHFSQGSQDHGGVIAILLSQLRSLQGLRLENAADISGWRPWTAALTAMPPAQTLQFLMLSELPPDISMPALAVTVRSLPQLKVMLHARCACHLTWRAWRILRC